MDQAFRFSRLQIPIPRTEVVGRRYRTIRGVDVKSLVNECQFGNL